MILWIVGKTLEGGAWEFQGVFSSVGMAMAICKPGYFIGPARLDQIVPDQTEPWPDAFDPFSGVPIYG